MLIVFLGIMAFGIQDGFGQTTQDVDRGDEQKRANLVKVILCMMNKILEWNVSVIKMQMMLLVMEAR